MKPLASGGGGLPPPDPLQSLVEAFCPWNVPPPAWKILATPLILAALWLFMFTCTLLRNALLCFLFCACLGARVAQGSLTKCSIFVFTLANGCRHFYSWGAPKCFWPTSVAHFSSLPSSLHAWNSLCILFLSLFTRANIGPVRPALGIHAQVGHGWGVKPICELFLACLFLFLASFFLC